MRLHGPGTDLTVGLLPSSVWHAADFTTVDGLRHFPNIPSEEIFTTPTRGAPTVTSPRRDRSRSTARWSTGSASRSRTDARCGSRPTGGADTLRSIAARDDGASRLGELALVDGEGRIGIAGTTFFETLLDENAASHIALGNGYAPGVVSEDDRARVNPSTVHVDFMIGSPELDVDGLTRDGDTVPPARRLLDDLRHLRPRKRTPSGKCPAIGGKPSA